MAEPPRHSNLLPWENSIIYFVTICVKDRWQGRYDSRDLTREAVSFPYRTVEYSFRVLVDDDEYGAK